MNNMNKVKAIIESLRQVLDLHRNSFANVIVQIDDILFNWESCFKSKIYNYIKDYSSNYEDILNNFLNISTLDKFNLKCFIENNKDVFNYIEQTTNQVITSIKNGL